MNRSEQVLITKDEDVQRAAFRSIDWLGLFTRIGLDAGQNIYLAALETMSQQ